MHHILSVDDDYRIRELLFDYLTGNGFYVNTVVSVQEAERLLELFFFDLIILDIMMPGEDGISFLQRLRGLKNTKQIHTQSSHAQSFHTQSFHTQNSHAQTSNAQNFDNKVNKKTNKSNIPVLLLSAKGEVEHRIGGLEKGADEYLPKPFEPRELLLRIKNILKRTKNDKTDNIVRFGEFSFDLSKMILKQAGNFIFLNEVEKKLMELLIRKENGITNREELAKLLKNTNPRSVDVSIGRLRQKIEKDPKTPQFLQTIRGSGYILNTGENYYNENNY